MFNLAEQGWGNFMPMYSLGLLMRKPDLTFPLQAGLPSEVGPSG